VIDAHQGYGKAQREGARCGSHGAQARPQSRTLGEGDGVDLQALLSRVSQHLSHYLGHVLRMMLRRLARVYASFGRGIGSALLVDHALLVHQGGAKVPGCPFQT